jgi:hypothetical protein
MDCHSRATCCTGSRRGLARWGGGPGEGVVALLFARALGQTPHYWLNLQAAYDLKTTEAAISSRLEAIPALVPT